MSTFRSVKQLREELEMYPDNMEIVTEPNDHTYWKGIDVGRMRVEVLEGGEYCDTLDESGDNIKEVLFVGVG